MSDRGDAEGQSLVEQLGGEDIGQTSSIKKVAIASLIGTTIEWYDFLIYGTAAALVFNTLFFPQFSETAGTLAAFSTFAVAFFARPVGGVVFGHFGDRIGRKTVLVLTIMLMGIATFLVGVMPTYDSIGIWAPVGLVLLRFVQGFAVGGEWGGAVLMSVEHAPRGKRGFYGSFPEIGVPAAVILSSLAFLALSTLSEEQFLAWGWRVPFLLSIILVAVGLYIRLKIMETPMFERVRATHTVSRIPIADVLRNYRKEVALVAGSFLVINAVFYILVVFVLSYATTIVGVERNTILTVILISGFISLFTIPAFAALSDKVGRKPLYITGAVGMGLSAAPLFWLLDTGVFIWMLLGHVITLTFMNMAHGLKGAFYSEQFETRVRYSGASLAYQGGSIFGGAFAPFIAVALLAWTGTPMFIALYMAALAVIAVICTLLLRETYQSDIDSNIEEAASGEPQEHPLA